MLRADLWNRSLCGRVRALGLNAATELLGSSDEIALDRDYGQENV